MENENKELVEDKKQDERASVTSDIERVLDFLSDGQTWKIVEVEYGLDIERRRLVPLLIQLEREGKIHMGSYATESSLKFVRIKSSNKFKEVKFTSWDGSIPMRLTVPEICDRDLKETIISFFSELDDHDAMTECFALWKTNDEEFSKEMETNKQEDNSGDLDKKE